ncbi:hypothetical protein Ancab_002748 [Ancistrocladus abbreviatus]
MQCEVLGAQSIKKKKRKKEKKTVKRLQDVVCFTLCSAGMLKRAGRMCQCYCPPSSEQMVVFSYVYFVPCIPLQISFLLFYLKVRDRGHWALSTLHTKDEI